MVEEIAICPDERVERLRARVRQGGKEERRRELASRGKGDPRKRLESLLDPGFVIEDWILARHDRPDLPADGIVTVVGRVGGRPVCVMANDMAVRAGTWGIKTIEKIQRLQEVALNSRIPIVYLVDSGGARIDEQYGLFLDRRHSGRIFWNMARMNGVIPQVCVNFGPSPAGAAYLPAFCDLVVMIEGLTSVFLGSPRQVAAATGEQVTEEEMGGARMHCSVSGLGDVLVQTETDALEAVRHYLSYLPSSWHEEPPDTPVRPPLLGPAIQEIVPEDQARPFDMRLLIDALVDEESFFEIKREYAGEILTGYARIDGMSIGVVANQSLVRGGILTPNAAEKGAQFISTCTAFNVPLAFLMDVPGFMIGSQVERAAIIRRGQKMLQAVAESVQPRICVVVRKGYGAGYMAMSGATFQPDCTIALPQAKLGIMGPAAAVQAIYARKLADMPEAERATFVEEKRREYEEDIGVWGPAAEMYVDDVVPGAELRSQLIERLRLYRRRPGRPGRLIQRRTHILRG